MMARHAENLDNVKYPRTLVYLWECMYELVPMQCYYVGSPPWTLSENSGTNPFYHGDIICFDNMCRYHKEMVTRRSTSLGYPYYLCKCNVLNSL